MNVKISSRHNFLAGFWWDDSLEFNSYTLDIDMTTATADIIEQNIAFLRLRYIIEDTLSNVVFINQQETEAIENLKAAGVCVAVLPEDPVDQIVGMALHSKLSSVVEDRIVIRAVRLQSIKGDNIVYEHSDNELNPLFEQYGWWSTTDPEDTETTESSDHVTVITSSRRWRDLDMAWMSDVDTESSENVVVFGEFRRDEN